MGVIFDKFVFEVKDLMICANVYWCFWANKNTSWFVDFVKEHKKLENGKTGSDKEFY
ncbi:MAG: hypothetical protein IKW39_04575 [Alphaproteobacteria bacterium]|nr:hypothetical protein [Alphaproteobacteria bacterium]